MAFVETELLKKTVMGCGKFFIFCSLLNQELLLI